MGFFSLKQNVPVMKEAMRMMRMMMMNRQPRLMNTMSKVSKPPEKIGGVCIHFMEDMKNSPRQRRYSNKYL